MPKPVPITARKLLLAEGEDPFHFFCHACGFYREDEDVQVMNFGGNQEFPEFLSDLSRMDKYDEVDSIVIARDAEKDATAAIASVRDSMKKAEMPAPKKSFEYARKGTLKTAIMIFPGPQQKDGTLEDLCLSMVKDDPIMECVDDCLKCACDKGVQFHHVRKNKLHCFLAVKDESIRSRLGLAFEARVWPKDHPALEPFKTIIQEM